jgi:CheY-like chemotaxis protein
MSNPAKILVVDDEPVGRQLLEAILVPEGYDIYFGADGEEAIQVAISEIPDIILLDVMMPKLDGFEVCKKLRKNSSTAHIPIFLITALDDRDSKIRGIDMGADDYISKPFDRIEILAKIKNKTSQVNLRNKAGKSSTEAIKSSEYNQSLITALVESFHHVPEIKGLQEIFYSKNVLESKHGLYISNSANGQYIYLISNQLQDKNANLANSIFCQYLNRATFNKEFYPNQVFSSCLEQMKIGNDEVLRLLTSAGFSILVLFNPYGSKDIYIFGDQSVIFIEQGSSANSIQYESFLVNKVHDLKINLPAKIVLLSNNILDKFNPEDIVDFLNAYQDQSSDKSVIQSLKEHFDKIEDFIIARITY